MDRHSLTSTRREITMGKKRCCDKIKKKGYSCKSCPLTKLAKKEAMKSKSKKKDKKKNKKKKDKKKQEK